jgi:glycosyltransferase involved in cell wall biosynthesis
MPDLVSVVIPCYNGAAFLAEAIASIYHQTYPQIELILVDDGSTDDTAAIAARYPDARYLYQPNQGVAIARNRGLAASSGEYLLFLDQDDRLLPHCIETALQQMVAHPDCAFVFGQSQMIDAAGNRVSEAPWIPVGGYEDLLRGKGNICPPSTVLFRQQPLVASGGFDAQFGMADDYDVYLKLARQFPIAQYAQTVVEYRQYESNQPIAKLIQLRSQTQAALDAQKPFVVDRPDDRVALEAGETHWQYFWETILLHRWLKALWQGKWQDVRLAGQVLRRSPILFSAIYVYLSWWLQQAIQLPIKFFSKTLVSTRSS